MWIHGMDVAFFLGLGWTDFVGSSGVEAFYQGQGHMLLLVLASRVGQRGFVRWSLIYLAD